MANVQEYRGGFALSGQGTGVSAFSSAFDTRGCRNYAYLEYVSYAPSCILIVQASKDGLAGWVNVQTVTATTTTAIAQVAGYHPFTRIAYSTGWAATASANAFYAPGAF